MTGYIQVSLKDMIDISGEDKVKSILSDFSCPLNLELEDFLKYKAIEFAKQQISSTQLVFTSYKGKPVLIGYYTVAMKVINISKCCLSKRLRSRINKFTTYDKKTGVYNLPAPLIGQLGKNYKDKYNELITGDELLKMACDKIKESLLNLSGKVVYLECEDTPRLIEFYSENGFCEFGKRELDKDETSKISGEHLIQMLKYLD